MGYDTPVKDWSFDLFFEKHVVAEDHEKVHKAWEVASGGERNLEFDCRITRADGTLGWIWCKSRIFYNEAGKPSFLMGFVGDETAAKSAEQEIAKYYGKDLGAVTTLRFSDGEMSPSFDESVRGCDVFIIQSTFPTAIS